MKKAFLLIICFCLSSNAQKKEGQALIDSLNSVIPNLKDDTIKVKAFCKLGLAYINQDPQKGLLIAEKAINLSNQLKWNKGLANSHQVKANILGNIGKPSESLIEYNKSISFCLKNNDGKKLSELYIDIGDIYSNQGKFSNALNFYFKSLKEGEKNNDSYAIGDAYANLGNATQFIRDNDKAIQYYLKAIKSFKKINKKGKIGLACVDIGFAHFLNKNYPMALKYLLLGQKLSTEAKYKNGIVKSNSYLALYYHEKKDYRQAIKHFETAIKLEEINPYRYGLAYAYIHLANSYLELYSTQKNQLYLKNAKYNLDKAFGINKEYNNTQGLFENYLAYSRFYELNGDYKTSLENYKLSVENNNKIYNKTNSETIKNLEDKRTIEVKENQLKINQLQLQAKEKQKWFYLFGIGLFAIIGGLLFYQSRSRQKTNEKLQLLNTELDQANKTKTRFFSILNHDLRGPVANLIHFLHLQKDNPELLDEETKKRMQNKTISGAENLLSSMEDILLWSKGQMENFKPQVTTVYVNHLFEDTKKVLSGYHKIKFEYQNPDNVSVYTDENYLKTIVRNLTSNAINVFTTTSNPTIIWKAWQESGVSYLSITDNGPGASKEQFKALYDDKEVVGIKSGLGLHLIRDLAKAINCEISVDSIVNEGTTFKLKL